MADQSDVEQVLAAIVSGVLYPRGATGASLVGAPCDIHRGWPVAARLDNDLLAGRVTVTVAGDTLNQRTTTRYPDEWRALRTYPPTLTIAVAGQVATLGGVADEGQLAGLMVGRVAAVHRTQPGDTPALVAMKLASALISVRGVFARDSTVVAPAGYSMLARAEADQPNLRETRRQTQAFRIVFWCPDPASRDRAAGAVDQALSAFDFLGLPDGMAGRLRFLGTASSDRAQAAALYRRDLIYSVDYATTIAADLPRLLFGDVRVFGNGVLVKTLLS